MPLVPEEGEGEKLEHENKGHPAESVIDGTQCGRVSQPKMEYFCVLMNWAAMKQGQDKRSDP